MTIEVSAHFFWTDGGSAFKTQDFRIHLDLIDIEFDRVGVFHVAIARTDMKGQ